MYSISTKNLQVAYEKKVIVKDLSLNIPKGKITTIIGPNGCGKSTLLKSIGRILKPKNGTIYLNGENIKKFSTKEIAKDMAILSQSPKGQNGLLVSELVSYGRFPHQKSFNRLTNDDNKIINWALEITGLSDFKEMEVESLSGGQRQRVWIAMALAQKTELILLDEPTTYLDMAYQLEILKLLYDLNRKQNCTIVMVLHDLNLAARFADYMIALRDGNIVRHGKVEEVMTHKVLKDTFQIDAEIILEKKTNRPTCVSYELIK